MSNQYSDFEITGLWAAMDAKREAMGFSEKQMMDDLNSVNNNRIPMSLATVKNMLRRNDISCQHSLHMLRWLNRTPESFLVGTSLEEPLPFPDDGRLYWDLPKLAVAVTEVREDKGLTWKDMAKRLSCSPNQVSGLHKLKYGISVHLAMRITQMSEQHSSAFIVVI